MKKAIQGMRERTVENEIEYEMEDKSSGIEKKLQIVKIRKLNRKNWRKFEAVVRIPMPDMRAGDWRKIWFTYRRGTSH